MGDLNGHVGADRRNVNQVIGAFGVGERNREGEFLIDMCLRNTLAIMNTFFRHREWTLVSLEQIERRIHREICDRLLHDK